MPGRTDLNDEPRRLRFHLEALDGVVGMGGGDDDFHTPSCQLAPFRPEAILDLT